jgi:N-methylhydantoinase A/oxoprolinase/acetone carboxylase beta subunit
MNVRHHCVPACRNLSRPSLVSSFKRRLNNRSPNLQAFSGRRGAHPAALTSKGFLFSIHDDFPGYLPENGRRYYGGQAIMILGLDVGGTHTDVVLMGDSGLMEAVKVPTRHDNLFETVVGGIDAVMAGRPPDDIGRIVLSTTLTTNAVVQGNVPPVGVIVSGGPGIDPAAHRISDHYYPVAGAIDHRGRERQSLDLNQIRRIADDLAANDIRHVAVVGKFSTRNPVHELAVEELLADTCEVIFCGHRLSGMLNFPRRIATSYLNAAVYPVHMAFYAAVMRSLKERGLAVPIRILKADGGNMSFDASVKAPAQTINSGPAASVMGAMVFSSETEETLIMDIGGTTTDMAILVNDAPLLDPVGIALGGYQTLIRSLNTYSVGIGGDSALRVPESTLTIGPDRRGPAMGYGGPAPTPTDAMMILGLTGGDGDREAARSGFRPLADALGMRVADAARHVFDETCRLIVAHAQRMIDGINSRPVYTVHEVLEGYQVDPKLITVMGGPALPFARRIEELSDFQVGVVPKSGVANAIGAALARTTSDVTLFVDTQQGFAVAPEEGVRQSIGSDFSLADARALALALLKDKAIRNGANADHLEMEVVEEQSFNMVRGFYTAGKNIRIRAQIKPGLIHGFENISRTFI